MSTEPVPIPENPLADLRAELDAVRHDLAETLGLVDRLLGRWEQITDDIDGIAAVDARIAVRDRAAESLVGAYVTCSRCGAELTIAAASTPNDVVTVTDNTPAEETP